MKLLLIEDDLDIGNGLQKVLGNHGFVVVWVRTLAAAQRYLVDDELDLAVLDLGLPDGDGMTWLMQMRASGMTQPVLILSARDGLQDRLQGLDRGADDFLVKPFELPELLARLNAMARRWRGFGIDKGRFSLRGLDVDVVAMRVSLDGLSLSLSQTEFNLLQLLLQRQGRVVARSFLEDQALRDGGSAASLDMHMSNLRRKLGRDLIRTVRGVGYVIDRDDANEVA